MPKRIQCSDEAYPKLLREIYDPPKQLYIAGHIPNANHYIAIVGSRMATPYGKRCTERLVSSIPDGFCIVSGLAYGIDTAAHTACIQAGIPSIAILAGGHQKMSLREKRLAKHIIENGGAVISEQEPDKIPHKGLFPIRNRIISGMSKATIVIEAALRSGSLITARTAMEQNREVFALPGPVNSPQSAGTNGLIAQGAIPLINRSVITEYFGSAEKTRIAYKPENDTEKAILTHITDAPMHIDHMIEKTGMDAATIMATLSELELKQAIIQEAGMQYRLP